MIFDSRSLARESLSFNTINPPGDEGDCAQFLDHLLEEAGCDAA